MSFSFFKCIHCFYLIGLAIVIALMWQIHQQMDDFASTQESIDTHLNLIDINIGKLQSVLTPIQKQP